MDTKQGFSHQPGINYLINAVSGTLTVLFDYSLCERHNDQAGKNQ